MNSLFGLSMDTIMLILLAPFVVSIAGVAMIFLRSRHMFRMGLRNIPRRGLQSGLVIIGLMLATLITTAAFTTGDTVDHSIRQLGVQQLGRTDLQLNFVGEENIVTNDLAVYFPAATTPGLEDAFATDPDVEGFIPLLVEPAGAFNPASQLSEASITLVGVDPGRLDRLGGLTLGGGGKADLAALGENEIFLSERAAEKLDAAAGDTLSLYLNGAATDLTVKGIVEDEVVSSGSRRFYERDSGGGAVLLSTLQRLSGHEGQINRLNVALRDGLGDTQETAASAVERLEAYLQSESGRQLLGSETPVTVDTVKADAIEEAEVNGNLFTTFFLVLGLFSIAAGIMLIFMIFVMLATERKPEMGMARAVGAQRSSLVQAFLSEGMAYTVLAGAVGALAGVAAAVLLVAGFLRIVGGFDFVEAKITARSLVISYCLGVVITFLTVLFSSLRVSSVNIVSAIRGTDDDSRPRERRKVSWRWLLIGLPAMVVPPLGIWFFFRKGLGIAWTWIIAPVGFLLGIFAVISAEPADSQFLFSFGVSVLPLCLAMVASRLRAPARLIWTLVGVCLAIIWLAPVDYAKLAFGRSLAADIEMFPLSGVMVVIAFTLIIVYNARLLTAIIQRGAQPRYTATAALAALTIASFAAAYLMGNAWDGTGELLYLFGGVLAIGTLVAFAAVWFPHLAPALKMGIAYPLANRFRTGMAIAMFSLIIFSLSTFGAINASYVSLLKADGGDGGWDVVATAGRNTASTDLVANLEQAGAPVVDDIAAVGRVTTFTGFSQVREADGEYRAFPVLAADDAFLRIEDAQLHSRARGYEDEAGVFAAVASGSGLALADPSILPEGFNEYEVYFDVPVEDERFEPFEVLVRDPRTGKETAVTVIGILSMQLPSKYATGIYLNEADYREAMGAPEYLRSFVRLESGVDAAEAAQAIESTLVRQGIQAESTRKLLDDVVQEQNTFIRMFQGFMALGLLTGVAALGVIAFRSVVERRQQIGMLRAIGYQAGTIALTFVLESGFIALMGILSGVVGGMIVARNLFTSGQFAGSGTIEFTIPWPELLITVGIAFAVSMFMTWWPSRQASRVPVADALRYE